MSRGEELGLSGQKDLGLTLSLPLTSQMTLSSPFHSSEPQFPRF